MASKDEWEATLRQWKNRCAFCGKTEKEVVKLEKAHLKARSRGGSQVFPLCPLCHIRYDTGKATAAQLKKIGVDPAKYNRMKPPKGKGRGGDSSESIDIKSIREGFDREFRRYGL